MRVNLLRYAFRVLEMGHYTPANRRINSAFAISPRGARHGDPEVKYIGQAPHVISLPDGRLSKRLSGTSALCAGAYEAAGSERPVGGF